MLEFIEDYTEIEKTEGEIKRYVADIAFTETADSDDESNLSSYFTFQRRDFFRGIKAGIKWTKVDAAVGEVLDTKYWKMVKIE